MSAAIIKNIYFEWITPTVELSICEAFIVISVCSTYVDDVYFFVFQKSNKCVANEKRMDLDCDDADLLAKLLDTFDQTHTVGDFAFSIRSIILIFSLDYFRQKRHQLFEQLIDR
jgi:hypothetical protein